MGSKFSRKKKRVPPNEDFAKLASQTPFNVSEVEALYELYKKLSNSLVNDGYIQKEELLYALFRTSNKQNLFADRIFDLFDVKQTGDIDFGEFVRSLSIFHPKTPEAEKITCAFRLYDLRHTGYIEHEETFEEADINGDGRIDQEEWKLYATKNPLLLKNMTLPYLIEVTLTFPSFVMHAEADNSKCYNSSRSSSSANRVIMRGISDLSYKSIHVWLLTMSVSSVT